MPKYKPYKGLKRGTRQGVNAVPCLILVALGLILISMLFYSALRSS